MVVVGVVVPPGDRSGSRVDFRMSRGLALRASNLEQNEPDSLYTLRNFFTGSE